MKTKTKILVAALTAAGIVAPLQQAWADTINAGAVAPLPQSVVPTTYAVSYPVIVTLAGGAPQNLTFTYNADGTWATPTGWTYEAALNPNANTAVFTTNQGGVAYGVALSSTGSTQFVPGQTGGVTVPPSVGTAPNNTVVTNTVLPGFAAATATGTVTGFGQTTATLVGASAVAQIIGVGAGGAPVGAVVVGAPITVNPSTAQSAVGSASGSVVVNSNQPVQAVGYGAYTVTVPNTQTPPGTSTIAGTIAGNGGSFGAAGINVGAIVGTATYDVNTGAIVASPVYSGGFSVNANGNTTIGCAGANTGTSANLTVCGSTTTTGITNNGTLTNNGNVAVTGNETVSGTLTVGGQTNTNGIVNTGNTRTTTLTVTGASTTTGITNTGNIATTTLNTTGNATVGGTLTANGIANTGNIATGTLAATGNATVGGNLSVTGTSTLTGNTTVGGTLGVTGATTLNGATQVNNTLGVSGAATLNGATQINNTLGVTGATTIGSASGTGGNTVTVNSSGIVLTTPGVGANNVTVNSSGSSITGGGATLAMANGRATFAGANTAPIRVTGIADGANEFDAVNYRQYQDLDDRMKSGIAGVAAIANIPQVEQGKTFAIGVGVGGFDGEAAFAVGGSVRVARDGILKASVGFGSGGNSSTTWGVGGAWNWQ